MKMEVEKGSRMEKVSDNSASSVSALSEGEVTFISQTHSFLLRGEENKSGLASEAVTRVL